MTGKAVEWEALEKRPKVKTLKVKGRDKLIDHDTEIKVQQELTVSTAHGRHNRCREQTWPFMVILQDPGMRPDAVFPMKIEHIDWANNRIWVPEGKTVNSRRFVGMRERMEGLLPEWRKAGADGSFPPSGHDPGTRKPSARDFRRPATELALVRRSFRTPPGTPMGRTRCRQPGTFSPSPGRWATRT